MSTLRCTEGLSMVAADSAVVVAAEYSLQQKNFPARLIFCSLTSLLKLILKSALPVENVWKFARWMPSFQ